MTGIASTTLDWTWRGKTIRLAADASGTGPKVLLLPALSSISTRREMHPLQQRLAARYSTLAVDWPGFGEAPRPQLDWTPDAYAAFVAFVLNSVMPHPHAIIAAGHAATYVLKHAAGAAAQPTRLVLVAPTWRGPLPTMAGGHRPFFDRLCRLVDVPPSAHSSIVSMSTACRPLHGRRPRLFRSRVPRGRTAAREARRRAREAARALRRCASSPVGSIRSQAARLFSMSPGERGRRSCWFTVPTRRRSRAQKWRRSRPFPAFARRGFPAASSRCTRNSRTRPSTPSSRSLPRTPP